MAIDIEWIVNNGVGVFFAVLFYFRLEKKIDALTEAVKGIGSQKED